MEKISKIKNVNKQCLLNTSSKVMTALKVLKKMHLNAYLLQVVSDSETNRQTDIQTDLWVDINCEVKSGSRFVKNVFFSRSKHRHAHVQYVFNESAKYHNLLTNSSSQVDFTMHALSPLHHLRLYKTQ